MDRRLQSTSVTPIPTMAGSFRSALLSSVLAFGLGAGGFAASSCGDSEADGEPTSGPVGPGTTGSGGEGGQGGGSIGEGGATGESARDVFEATVREGLMAECGACHQLQGSADAPFLAAPDQYVSVTTYPGVVVPNANQSVLITRPADPGHGGGQAPNMSDALRAEVLPWLALEAARIPPNDSSTQFVTPFKPKLMGALNTVYLGDLDPTLENVSITFNAYELGQPPNMLVLENLEVHPIADMSLRVVHPLFTMYPDEGGDPVPDPADSFSGLDDLFEVTGRRKLGTGTLVHTGWEKDAFLGMAFELVEIVGGYIPPTDCLALAAFDSGAKPALNTCATQCHGGQNPQATGAMDLTTLATDSAKACRQVRARIKPGAPAQSQILVVTNPLDLSAHVFKFQGSLTAYDTFKNQVTPWINAED
jgi:hypothetical protein